METKKPRSKEVVAGLTERNGAWRIRWRDESGRRRSEQYADRDEAMFQLESHRHLVKQILRGLVPPPPPDVTFDDLANYWIARRVPRKRSGKGDESIIRCHLLPAFSGLPLRKLGTAQADTFMADRQHLQPKTVANIIILLRAMLRKALHLGWLLNVPHIEKQPRRNDPTHENYLQDEAEILALLWAARAEGENVFALYATALYTGARAGELAGLHWSDVDLQARRITIRRSYDQSTTKSGKRRFVPILDPLLPVLQRWRELNPGHLVFTNRDGRMLGRSAPIFQETFQRVLKAAGLTPIDDGDKARGRITFHGLRHTYCSHLLMNGGDPFLVQQLLGHGDFKTTQIYAHTNWARISAERDRLGSRSLLELVPEPERTATRTAQDCLSQRNQDDGVTEANPTTPTTA